MLVTNSVTIRTETGIDDANNLFASTPGLGDINVNQPVSWTASGVPTTLSLYAVNDINLNAAVTATKGNFVAIAGRDVNAYNAITTTDGSLLMCAIRDINIDNTGGDRLAAITTTRGNFTAVAGHNLNIKLAKITTTGSSSIADESLGLDLGLVLSAGNDGTGPGVAGGTVNFTPGTPPAAVTNAPATIYYNPVSYTTPTNYLVNFTLTEGAALRQFMLVFPDGGDKVYDGTTVTTLSGLKGSPAGVTLLAGADSTADFANPLVGIDKRVLFSGYELIGVDAGKYAFTGTAAVPVAAICCAQWTTAAIAPAPTIAPTPGAHDRTDTGAHDRTDPGAHDRTDTGAHDRTDAGAHDRTDTGTHDRTDAGTHDRTDAGAHDRTDPCTHDRTDPGTHDRTDAGTHDRTDAGAHDRTDAGAHDRTDTGTHDRTARADAGVRVSATSVSGKAAARCPAAGDAESVAAHRGLSPAPRTGHCRAARAANPASAGRARAPAGRGAPNATRVCAACPSAQAGPQLRHQRGPTVRGFVRVGQSSSFGARPVNCRNNRTASWLTPLRCAGGGFA